MSAEAVAAALVAREAEVRAQLERFIGLPSVSTDPAYAGGSNTADPSSDRKRALQRNAY